MKNTNFNFILSNNRLNTLKENFEDNILSNLRYYLRINIESNLRFYLKSSIWDKIDNSLRDIPRELSEFNKNFIKHSNLEPKNIRGKNEKKV